MSNMKIEDILENGYEKHYDSIEDITWYEKEIKDDNFKNIYLIKIYDKYGSFEVCVQFQKNDYIMNIQIFNISKYVTISEIEKEIKLVWNSLQKK